MYSIVPEKIISIDDADWICVKNIHGTENGHKFASRSLFTEFAFTEKIYDKMLDQMDNMFSSYYLKEKYLPLIREIWDEFNYKKWDFENGQQTLRENTPIWICWLQGIEDAPEIVKCCIGSIISNVDGKKHIITYDNYSSYVTLGAHIIKKHESGIISKTHFSDILRLALLCKYGGIWMDATILMMDEGLPDYIYKSPIFMYKIRYTMEYGYMDPRFFTNWFIKSEKENPVLSILYKTIEEYWRLENKNTYCLFHYILRLIWDNYIIGQKYSNRLNIYDDRCRVLRKIINEKYDKVLWDMIKEEEPLQKLSYKNMGDVKKDSFYQYILLNYKLK